MSDHLKQYSSFALCALLLNLTLFSSAYLMATEEVLSQDETAQSAENIAENNEQSDEQVKKPTFAESWRKVVTLRLKELSKADAWNIGAPVAGMTVLGLLCHYFLKDANANNANHNPGPNNPSAQNLQESKNKFEKQLQLDLRSRLMPLTTGVFGQNKIDADPIQFLKYCYYQNYYEYLLIDPYIKLLDNCSVSLFEKCKAARVDDYSALGAAIIAKKIRRG